MSRLNLAVGVLLTVMTLTAIMFLVFGRVAAQRARQAWRSGYWTGKSELQTSLDRFLLSNQSELEQDPELLGPLLLIWIENEDLSNRALAELQEARSR